MSPDWFSEYVTVDNVCLGVNAITLGLIYKIYRSKTKNFEAVQTARQFDIDSHLVQKLREEYPDGKAVHAVVRGQVKSLGDTLKSRHIRSAKAVIQECVLTEHKIQWSPFSRFWSHTQREIQRVINYVPFALASRHSGATVEVVDPLECEDVPVQCVYENFIPNREGLSGVLFGWLRGEQTKGIEEQEMLLEEGATLTGFGTLATEKGTDAVRLMPPADGSCYYLTHLSHPALVSKLKSEVDVLRVACFVFGFTAAGLSVYILLSWWQRRQRRIQEMKDATRREEAKKERRKQTRDAAVASEYPNCVICLSNPVEVMMLECGHVCVCTDCAEQVRDTCPVCRAPIARSVAAFLP
ncbi:mitochondrial ubiquitin ligase activator of NFKB 1-like [Ixodes scapularis]|uniref:mitochondrial ubiquitin ligase activator of NFKB 1 n=1 Tax=Ixodes scapularis TaxID=6945 RepID=UPI001161AAF3|nr:mitochondrial ubiquitin ligase activator of NFKB 1 [Ixodes scapularis]XP_042146868.1 mitochondrial ubiquitin ligase activator of NFKB 1-like [Ixodes scapularis]